MTMNDTFGRLLVSAKMLYANAEGCAVNHHGEDFALHGLPGWLADCRADIAAAEAAHARAQAEPVAAGAWTREDLAAGLAELDGIDLVPPLKSVVDLEYLNRADDLLTFLSVASAANEPLGAIHPAPAQEPVAVPAGFVLVPVEPTPEMLATACASGPDHPVLKFLSPEERSPPTPLLPLAYYRAMLSAAVSSAQETTLASLDRPCAWWAETGGAGAGEGCNKPFWLRHEAIAYVQKHGGHVAPLFRRYAAPVSPAADSGEVERLRSVIEEFPAHDFATDADYLREIDQWWIKSAMPALASHTPAPQPGTTSTDCRTEEGVTVGLIDSIITAARVLADRSLDPAPVREALKDLRADSDVLKLLPQLGVAVKGLEWHETEIYAVAADPYTIAETIEEKRFSLQRLGLFMGRFDTLEAAKAAAQADYERRILSAIEPSPSQWNAGAEAMQWDCAAVVESFAPGGENYEPGHDDASMRVAIRGAILALPLPTPAGEG